jgi:hypothetical protein
MSKGLFLQIVAAAESHDDYFHQKPDTLGVLGTSTIQNAVVAFHMLAYIIYADFFNDYVTMRERERESTI